MYSSALTLTLALDRVGGQCHTTCALPPGIETWKDTGSWVGLRAGLDGCGKSCPPSEFDPSTIQPVVSHYTNLAVLTHSRWR